MIGELLQDRAALYVSGAMSEKERDEFELLLEFHGEIRQLVTEMQEVGSALLLSSLPVDTPAPSTELRSKILLGSRGRAQRPTGEGFVVTGPDRLVQWVNPAFVAMCGYTLDELQGRKLGPILQGKMTDQAAVERMRSALHAHQPSRETMVNYRKDGSSYRVDIEITPILDDAGEPLYFVAWERELPLAA